MAVEDGGLQSHLQPWGSVTTPSQPPPWALDQNPRGVSDGPTWTMCPFLNQSRWPGGWRVRAHLGLMRTLGSGRLWVPGPQGCGCQDLRGYQAVNLSGPGASCVRLRLHASTSTWVLSPTQGPGCLPFCCPRNPRSPTAGHQAPTTAAPGKGRRNFPADEWRSAARRRLHVGCVITG